MERNHECVHYFEFIMSLNRVINISDLLLILFSINQYYVRLINGLFLLHIRFLMIFIPVPTPASVWGGPLDCIGPRSCGWSTLRIERIGHKTKDVEAQLRQFEIIGNHRKTTRHA